jgi:predicted dehydrogenase
MQWGFWLNEKAPNASWKLDPSTGGPNAFYDAGVHAIDLMLQLLPSPTTVTAIGQQSRFQTIVDNVAALVLCGETTVELSASQSIQCPLNSLTLNFEGGTIHIPHALSEQSFTRMEIISPSETVTRTFEPVNLYGKEIEDFIALLNGQTSVGTTLQEACHALQILEAITESYSTGRTIVLHDSMLVHG